MKKKTPLSSAVSAQDVAAIAAILVRDRDRWLDTATRHKNALIRERFMVIDAYTRAFSQGIIEGKPAIKLELADADLSGVTLLSLADATRVYHDLCERWPDAKPYTIHDFQEYAQKQADEMTRLLNQIGALAQNRP